MRAYLIDDEKVYFKLLDPALKKAGHTLGYASSGREGLENIAVFNPDVIILDINLTDTNGFEILERLHNDMHFRHVPVIFLTSSEALENKLKAFSLGAEDYLTKPFKPEELLARMEVLARRREYLKVAEDLATTVSVETSTVVTLHSLRGGVGCTSLTINLGFGYSQLWNKPTMLVDTVLTSGQIAMFLNASPKATWEDVTNQSAENIDKEMVQSLISLHKSGLRFVAAPKLPIPFETFADVFSAMLAKFREQNDFIVIDTPHDFSDIAIKSLDAAERIIFVMAPEMGSLRAAICALRTYDSLGYPPDKVMVILNHVSPVNSLKIPQIEKAIGHKIDIELPYAQEVTQSINLGEPFVGTNPNLPISMRLEDCAYNLSRDTLKNIPPALRTPTWMRVNRRLKAQK